MNSPVKPSIALHVCSDRAYEQIAFAELLIPEVANVFGDYWTRDGIKHAAYLFAKLGFGIDVEHDNVDVTSRGVYVAESFIARTGDQDFIEGSWVIGMLIEDPVLWQKVLDGELNGFSYEAVVSFLEAIISDADDGVRTGTTEPDTEDGHTHSFMAIIDLNGRPITGGTSITDSHSHTLTTHTVTEEADGHTHRYNLVQPS